MRDSSLRPSAHYSFDSLLDQPQHAVDQHVLPEFDLRHFSGPARDMDTAPQALASLSGSPTRATSRDRVKVRLNAIYAEERRVDPILQAKQRDLQALHNQMRAEEDRERREYEQHQRDRDALQTEADRLDNEHQARLIHFQREEKDLETQLARGRAQDARIQSRSRDPQTAFSADSSSPSESASRANSQHCLRARHDAMYAEERRFDALLRAKQDDLQSAYDQLQIAENDSAAGEEAPQEQLVSRY